jgi:hypothetical protein
LVRVPVISLQQASTTSSLDLAFKLLSVTKVGNLPLAGPTAAGFAVMQISTLNLAQVFAIVLTTSEPPVKFLHRRAVQFNGPVLVEQNNTCTPW